MYEKLLGFLGTVLVTANQAESAIKEYVSLCACDSLSLHHAHDSTVSCKQLSKAPTSNSPARCTQ